MLESKVCHVCEVRKPASDFNKTRGGTCLRPACKACQTQYEREKKRAQRDRNRSLTANQRRALRYKIPKEEVERLLSQETCDICGGPGRLCIDHCHKTGRIRGVLCVSCNIVLGMMHDSTETLERAITYLRLPDSP